MCDPENSTEKTQPPFEAALAISDSIMPSKLQVTILTLNNQCPPQFGGIQPVHCDQHATPARGARKRR
jgi:hypothetical protein